MGTATKTFESSYNTFSVAKDGKTVTAQVRWTEKTAVSPTPGAQAVPTLPSAVSSIAIAGGKITCAGQILGDAPAELTAAAAKVAELAGAAIESLIASGKIKP